MQCVVHGSGCSRMPEASQPVAGRWSGSDTTGKLPPTFEHPEGMPAGLPARSTLLGISPGERFSWRTICLHPCRGAVKGGHKTGGVAHAQPPATGWDASGIPFGYPCLFFVAPRCFRRGTAGIRSLPASSRQPTPEFAFALNGIEDLHTSTLVCPSCWFYSFSHGKKCTVTSWFPKSRRVPRVRSSSAKAASIRFYTAS